jgi:hypothetical protein
MESQPGDKYQLARTLRESDSLSFTEAHLQALWFEQWIQSPLHTDAGEPLTILQPGLWNHGAGPDFAHAALRSADGALRVGSVEIHHRATDWEAHGHGHDPAYEDCILHVVWEPPAKPYFPATRSFRRVPQVVLRDQLIAPWELLLTALDPLTIRQRPAAKPGHCQRELESLPAPQQLELLRQAGAFRLRRKADRWLWRSRASSSSQALWEALAEGLGYSQNKMPFRLLAQRLPISVLQGLSPEARATRLFGLSGFLPTGDLSTLPAAMETWVRPLWDAWWKERDAHAHQILPKRLWKLSGVRPLNRPERRLAALALLAGKFRTLDKAVAQADAESFRQTLAELEHGVWENFSTLQAPLAKPHGLLGAERIDDLLINVFLPFASHTAPQKAHEIAETLRQAPNKLTGIATQRVLGTLNLGSTAKEALVQQGLLQIYADYCLADTSGCALCPFPQVVKRFEAS